MTEAALAEDVPVVLMNRWRRHDVCAILRDHAVTWVALDILEAVEGDPGDYIDEPGHDPLVLDEHRWSRTWTLDQTSRILDADRPAMSLLAWMRERELSLQAVGYGNVLRYATPAGPLDDTVWTVQAAASVLSHDPAIETGMRRLFDWLLHRDWIVRRGTEYWPAQSALDAGVLAVQPRRKPHNGDPWPQVVVTRTGLTELHAALGGVNPTVLTEEQP